MGQMEIWRVGRESNDMSLRDVCLILDILGEKEPQARLEDATGPPPSASQN